MDILSHPGSIDLWIILARQEGEEAETRQGLASKAAALMCIPQKRSQPLRRVDPLAMGMGWAQGARVRHVLHGEGTVRESEMEGLRGIRVSE